MSEVEYLENLLDAGWTETVTGRPHDVPKPKFVTSTENLQQRLRRNDVVYITAAGPTNITPRGFEETEYVANMQIDIRAKRRNIDRDDLSNVFEDAYERMFGVRDNNNEGNRWPGLVGETLRILMDNWRGDKEFDLITPPEINDNSHQTGPNSARAVIDVELERVAWAFDTST